MKLGLVGALLTTMLFSQISMAESARVIVKFADIEAPLGANAKQMRKQQIFSVPQTMKHLKKTAHQAEVFTVESHSLEETLAELNARDDVVYAEEDRKVIPYSLTSPDDSFFTNGSQWYLQTNASSSNLGAVDVQGAWALGATGDGVVVAVVDTGFGMHEDFGSNIIVGHDFVGADLGVDAIYQFSTDGDVDGQDGRDNDATDPGDYVSADEILFNPVFGSECSGQSSSSWHGTLVGGVIGALHDNNQGIAAAAPEAQVLMVRGLGKCGGYTSDIMEGALWASGLFNDGLGAPSATADIVNLSLGSEGESACSNFEQQSITAMHDAGVLVVTASGNSSIENAAPGNCNHAINVAANTRTGSLTSYSNSGRFIDVAAPGGESAADIIVTLSHSNILGPITTASDDYQGVAGTSFSAPLVSSVLALMVDAANDESLDLTPEQYYGTLRATVTAFPGGGTCTTDNCGAGIVHAKNAVQAIIDNTITSEAFINKPVISSSSDDSGGNSLSLFYLLFLLPLVIRDRVS